MNIPMPSPEERRRSIAYIKAQGLHSRKSLFTVVGTLLKSFSFEHLFFGTADCLCIALMIFSSCIGAALILSQEYTCIIMIVIAPFFYLSAYLLSLWKESLFNTLAVQKACKYTPMYMTAFRMLAFSFLAVVLNIPAALLASFVTPSLFPKLILLSSCSLFGYAVLMTALQILTSKKWVQMALPVLWTACILGIASVDAEKAQMRLVNTSVLLLGSLTAMFILIYIIELNIYLIKGEKEYADR